jgi:predicted permease
LSALISLFGNNILPIFLAAGSGYLAAKKFQLAPRSLSQAAFYIFSPCLIFDILTTSQLNGSDVTRMATFAFANVALVGTMTWLIGRLLHLERRILVAVILTTMFANAGNYGLSLTLFAFDETVLAHASLYFVTMATLMFTVGTVIASLGHSSLKGAMLGLFKVPTLYAVIAALLFNHLSWQLPLPLERTVHLLGSAAIPVLMALMGIQLYYSQWNGHIKALTLSSFMRLLAAPALAIGLSFVWGLHGAARQAGILESAMPTAITTTVLATEYNVEPAFVSTVVFVSTLLSPLTVTPLLAYLGA